MIAQPHPRIARRLILPLLVAIAALVTGGTGGYLFRGATASSTSQVHQISYGRGSPSAKANPTPQDVEWCGPVAVCIP